MNVRRFWMAPFLGCFKRKAVAKPAHVFRVHFRGHPPHLTCSRLPLPSFSSRPDPETPRLRGKARLPRCPDSAKVVEAGESKDHAAVLGLWRGGGALQPQALEAPGGGGRWGSGGGGRFGQSLVRSVSF